MPCKTLKHDDVSIRVLCLPEDFPVRGNACCSGDEEFDRVVESEIVRRLEIGDLWAWATVCVNGAWEGLDAETYLGCCCYDNEEDFRKNSGYFEDMVDEVIDDLNRRMQNLYEKISL